MTGFYMMTTLAFNGLRKPYFSINPFSANFTKWSNTLKQFIGNLATNCLSVFDHFVGLVLKGLTMENEIKLKEIRTKKHQQNVETSEMNFIFTGRIN